MKETSAAAANPLVGLVSGFIDAWNRFWFAPGNPATLGLMRLCAGLLIVYVHLAYCYDLPEFFGKDAWVSTERAMRNRADSPWVAPSDNWIPLYPNLYLPDDLDMREALFQWLRGLPDDKQERLRIIDYIYGVREAPPDAVPNFIRALPDGAAAGVEPTSPEFYPQGFTKWQVARFIKNLPEDKAARLAKLDYMNEWGFDPDQLYRRGGYHWSVWFHVTDPASMWITHAAIIGVMLMFAVGFCTRVTSVLTWLAALSYIQRSPITLFGVDTMMNVLLIYLMIGPSGAALSVDRWLAHWWKARRARLAGKSAPPWTPPESSVSANFAVRMIQVHFCLIYLASGTSKLMGGNWWNGTAVYYTMANYEFAPLRKAWYLALMHSLAKHRLAWELIIGAGSFSTLALEIGLPFLVWQRRLRPYLVAASLLLHVFIALFMGLVVFSLLMATMVMSFIPGAGTERVLGWVRRRFGIEEAAEDSLRTPQLTAVVPAVEEAEEASDAAPAETEAVLQVVGQPETGVTLEKDKIKRKKEKRP